MIYSKGYCNVGTVIDVGEESVGSRKVIGLSQMVIMLVVSVPVNLCCALPKTVKMTKPRLRF